MSLQGVHVDTERHQRARAALARIYADNGRRRPCPRCGLMCLPESLPHHLKVAHGRAGSGSRPETNSPPHPSTPAEDAAGAPNPGHPGGRKPETHDA